MFTSQLALLKGYAFGHTPPLPDVQRRMYQAETTDNFRWAAKLFARTSPYKLKSSDLVDISIQNELAEIGEFAEVAHGQVNPEFVWKYVQQLCKPDFPLHGYTTLSRSRLVSSFRGTVTELQAYIAYRPETRQLVLALSGTSSLTQMIRNFDARLVPHPSGNGRLVHSGFWKMYAGIRNDARANLANALDSEDVVEIVFTGHSMAAVMCYLLCLDILEERISRPGSGVLQSLKLVVFGSPRMGNLPLALRWRELASRFGVKEYSVRGYNDGVPALPVQCLGYCHFAERPLYLAYNRLWRIPSLQSEYSLFEFDQEAIENAEQIFPLGGHNYYNSRDMELLLRRMKWFEPLNLEEDSWEELERRYRKCMREEERRNGDQELVGPQG